MAKNLSDPVVALYCRLSPRPDGTYEGVDTQEKWGKAYAAKTWPGLTVRVFADRGKSAADGGHRPGYEALRQAIAAGEVVHLWTVEQTRLQRTETGWFEFAAELDAAGITDVHTNRDGIVRIHDEVAGIKAVLAAAEVRKLKKRINDRLSALADEGRPAGTRPFGYVHGVDGQGKKTYLQVPEQVAIVHETADRVLAGWSLGRIVADLSARGISGAFGGKITATTIRSMLTSPAVAGWRVHKGRRIRGVWEPILDESTWEAVRDRLTDTRIVEREDGDSYVVAGRRAATARRYLLTGGTAQCGVCGKPLVAHVKQRRSRSGELQRTLPYYGCHPKTGGRGCVGIPADPLEDYVRDQLADELDKPEFRAALAEDQFAGDRERVVAQLRRVDEKRRALAKDWAADELTEEEWRTARVDLDGRERRLRVELASVPPPPPSVDMDAVREGWPYMNLDERREVIGMFIARVVVNRARPGTQGFDPGRVGIEWRTR